MEYNQVELGQHFQTMLNEKSILINLSDSLGEAGSIGRMSFDKYIDLENTIRTEIKALFQNNASHIVCNRTYDIIHDSILCDDKTICSIPRGYSVYIICCQYNSIMKYSNIYAVVTTPKKGQFLISVSTDNSYKIGAFIPK